MSTPTIEIEASEALRVELLAALVKLELHTGHECTQLRVLYAEVSRAHCLAKRYDEQQIRLPLPR